MPLKSKTLFLRWLLTNVVFFCGFGVAVATTDFHFHIVVKIMAVVVLVRFAVASGKMGVSAFRGENVDLVELSLASRACLKLGVLSMALGALIAFQGGLGDITQRVLGATTGLAITALAVACSLVLDHLRHWAFVDDGG